MLVAVRLCCLITGFIGFLVVVMHAECIKGGQVPVDSLTFTDGVLLVPWFSGMLWGS